MPDPERAPLIARAFEELATGRFTKQEVIARMTEAGLRTRRGLVLSPQSFGQMVRNPIYIGMVESGTMTCRHGAISSHWSMRLLSIALIDYHAEAVDELDVQGILAFAERILPRASDLRVQASLDYKQRLQQLFFPEGIAYDGNRFKRTAVTAPLFNYWAPSESADEKMVSRIFTSWNQMVSWLRQLQRLRRAAQSSGAGAYESLSS